MPARSRLAGHIRLLGIFWLAISGLRLLPGLILIAIFGYGGEFLPPDVPIFVPGLLRFLGTIFLVAGALGIAAGWGLLARQPWARMLAIVMACIGLLDVPFGTALGIYTLWVLLPGSSEKEYERIARAA
jgi:hypothetical protein